MIRLATPVDAVATGRLLFDFNAEFLTPTPTAEYFAERFEHLLAREDVIVVLADGEAGASDAVGFAFFTLRPTPYADGPIAHLEELYVRPELRSRGIGSALLERGLAEALVLGASEVHIGVDEGDVDARRFYERHGFSNLEPDTGERMLLYLRSF